MNEMDKTNLVSHSKKSTDNSLGLVDREAGLWSVGPVETMKINGARRTGWLKLKT